VSRIVEPDIIIDKDVVIPLRDGGHVVANVFLPHGEGPWPVILNYSPYGKDVHFSNFWPEVFADLTANHPEITGQSSLRHMAFETPDPEVWTRLGYAVVRVDSRGSGKSPGRLQPNSPQEFIDACDAVDWAGRAPWSNGRVGLLGISYYAAGQWMIAQHRPEHLAALQPWQGTSDFYRDRTRQGGIFSSGFVEFWWESVYTNQHGNGASRYVDHFTGERNTGPALPEAELAANRVDYIQDVLDHPLEDDWYRARSADLSKIEIPTLVGANWGGLQVHLRGTLLGFTGIASQEKWLRIQRGSYFLSFYHPDNVATQRAFFDRFLKGDAAAWTDEPRVRFVVRSLDDGEARTVDATDWPAPGTVEHRLHLDASSMTLGADEPAAQAHVRYSAVSGSAVFTTAPLPEEIEFAGPIRLRLRLASSTSDADVFVALRAYAADGTEATFLAASGPGTPVSLGWLRASHRKVDPLRSDALRPFHTHDEAQPLVPGAEYDLDVEIWPASLRLPRGARLELTVLGHDFVRTEAGAGFTGHADPNDRPLSVFGGEQTLVTGPEAASYLALPRIGIAPATNAGGQQ
jgi:predicted acyl esterase